MKRTRFRNFSLRQLFVFQTLIAIAVALIAVVFFRPEPGVRVEAGSPWGTKHLRLETYELNGLVDQDVLVLKIVESKITKLSKRKSFSISTPIGDDLRQLFSSRNFDIQSKVCLEWKANPSRSDYWEIDVTAVGTPGSDNLELLVVMSGEKHSWSPVDHCRPVEVITFSPLRFTPPFETINGLLIYRLMAESDDPSIQAIVYDIYLTTRDLTGVSQP